MTDTPEDQPSDDQDTPQPDDIALEQATPELVDQLEARSTRHSDGSRRAE